MKTHIFNGLLPKDPSAPDLMFRGMNNTMCIHDNNRLKMNAAAQGLKYMFDYLEEIGVQLSHIAINIGASDGVTLDPIKFLYTQKKFKGLLIESDTAKADKIIPNLTLLGKYHDGVYPGPHGTVDILTTEVTPCNIGEIIDRYLGGDLTSPPTSDNIDAISIDIDSYDYAILEKVIGYHPKFICVEVLEDIPPGILFEVKYDENFEYFSPSGELLLQGCSIDSVNRLAQREGYTVFRLDWNNAYLFRNDIVDLVQGPERTVKNTTQLYKEGYFNRPVTVSYSEGFYPNGAPSETVDGRTLFYPWKKQDPVYFEMNIEDVYKDLRKKYSPYLDNIVIEYTDKEIKE